MIRTLNYTITIEYEGHSIGQFLRENGCSRHVLTALKQTRNGILLNGTPAFTNQLLKEQDSLTIRLEETAGSPGILPVPLAFSIVYEDEDLLVIDKPANTPVHPSQGNYENTLANGVAWYFASRNIPFVFRCINRLDRDTTGLLILAKHGISAAALSAQMGKRLITRTYRALVEGVTEPEGRIDAPIGRVNGSTIQRCITPDGDWAATNYRTLSHLKTPKGLSYSRIELQLETGRTHQIRVHMKSIGHPLLGDTLYCPENPFAFPHQALHSFSLGFSHPVTGKKLSFSVPEPW